MNFSPFLYFPQGLDRKKILFPFSPVILLIDILFLRKSWEKCPPPTQEMGVRRGGTEKTPLYYSVWVDGFDWYASVSHMGRSPRNSIITLKFLPKRHPLTKTLSIYPLLLFCITFPLFLGTCKLKNTSYFPQIHVTLIFKLPSASNYWLCGLLGN